MIARAIPQFREDFQSSSPLPLVKRKAKLEEILRVTRGNGNDFRGDAMPLSRCNERFENYRSGMLRNTKG